MGACAGSEQEKEVALPFLGTAARRVRAVNMPVAGPRRPAARGDEAAPVAVAHDCRGRPGKQESVKRRKNYIYRGAHLPLDSEAARPL